ncbi:MAG: WYL domain-containing protein [Bacteroidales bacterium]|nr:WYL domain-containing protein [Bacteroidales bacterium]
MELDKFDRQLRLLLMLTQHRNLTVDDVSRQLSMSRRSIYRYIDSYKQMGFIVVKEGPRYHIDPESPFFKQITSYIHFTEDEAMTINQVLNSVYDNSPQVRHLREKLSSLYDYKVLSKHGVDEHIAQNLAALFEAVKTERMVVLRDYASPNSAQTSDRIVEPYLFVSENSEVRCYEIKTGQNKTFKLSRIRKVEPLDLLWSHKNEHAEYFTDLFHFSGEERFPVTLILGQLSMSLLVEEYPGASAMLKKQDDGRFLLKTEVCSYKGIGRFVMGLIDDIEIVDSPDFVEYLRGKVEDLTQKVGK